MKKALTLLMAVLFVAALFGGCAQERALRAVTLNEVTRSVFYAPLYVAVTLGYFADEGIELTIVTGGGSDKSMTALLSGDAQVALMGPETGVYVVNEGKEEHPIIIAQLTKRDGSFLVGRQSEADFKFESLAGKTIIGGRPGGQSDYVLRRIKEMLKSGRIVMLLICLLQNSFLCGLSSLP